MGGRVSLAARANPAAHRLMPETSSPPAPTSSALRSSGSARFPSAVGCTALAASAQFRAHRRADPRNLSLNGSTTRGSVDRGRPLSPPLRQRLSPANCSPPRTRPSEDPVAFSGVQRHSVFVSSASPRTGLLPPNLPNRRGLLRGSFPCPHHHLDAPTPRPYHPLVTASDLPAAIFFDLDDTILDDSANVDDRLANRGRDSHPGALRRRPRRTTRQPFTPCVSGTGPTRSATASVAPTCALPAPASSPRP